MKLSRKQMGNTINVRKYKLEKNIPSAYQTYHRHTTKRISN